MIKLLLFSVLSSGILITCDMKEKNLASQAIETNEGTRSILWEEYHPSHRNVDYFLLRIYSDGTYARYSNTLLEVDEKGNPKYSKVEYKWRTEGSIPIEAVNEIRSILQEKSSILTGEKAMESLSSKQNSFIKYYLDDIEYFFELPNKQYAPIKYEIFERLNEIVFNNLSRG